MVVKNVDMNLNMKYDFCLYIFMVKCEFVVEKVNSGLIFLLYIKLIVRNMVKFIF